MADVAPTKAQIDTLIKELTRLTNAVIALAELKKKEIESNKSGAAGGVSIPPRA